MKQFSLCTLGRWLVITLAAVELAATTYFFLYPFHIITGSVTGLSLVLSVFLPLKVSTISLGLNLILLAVSLVLLGRRFTASTVYVSLLLPLTLAVLERVCPNQASLTGQPILDAAAALFLGAIGSAVLFHMNSSSGGLDIPAKILNKYLQIEIGTALSALGFAASLSSVLVSSGEIVVLGLLYTYLSGMVIDHFIFGLNMHKRVCVISRKHEEIVDYILNELKSGASLYPVIGAYSGKQRMEIDVMLTTREYRVFINWLMKKDPEAFVTVYNASAAYFRPKDFGTASAAARYAAAEQAMHTSPAEKSAAAISG